MSQYVWTGSGVVGGPWVGYESEEMRKFRNAIEFLQLVMMLGHRVGWRFTGP